MTNGAHEAYLTQRVLSADPVELVRMLYAGASEAVETARARLAAGDIRGRSAAISKAVEILAELTATLDHTRAPELSRSLAALYDYMQRRLLEANFQQADAPLAEVVGLARSLAEAWGGVSASAPAPAAPAAHRSAVPAPPAPKTARLVWDPAANSRESALQGWSF
ncbi:MAG TPA: flagellar export chaperone FliS [Bryobacteraceae bacterium]|nr:flagellar export chaperone FliS [Bryobacteraceae bacterium]